MPFQTMTMEIAERKIGDSHPPYVIAEISANHGGNLKRALQLIIAAKSCGADAVKFQAYEPDTITIKSDKEAFKIKSGPWAGRNLYDLYSEAYTPFKWFPDLFAMAREIGIVPFASVFDQSSVDMLERLNCPAYKIASFELCDTPLIQYAAETGKPIIMSTGMASGQTIKDADDCIDLSVPRALLHCVSGYPTPASEANLHKIKYLRNSFLVPVGFSDHSLGIHLAVAAVALGASIIEKHLTLDKFSGGPDAKFSLEPVEFKAMVSCIQETYAALQYSRASSEDSSLPFQRSLYVVKDIQAGERVTAENVRSIRPGGGGPARLLPSLLGCIVRRELGPGDPLSLDDLSDEALPQGDIRGPGRDASRS